MDTMEYSETQPTTNQITEEEAFSPIATAKENQKEYQENVNTVHPFMNQRTHECNEEESKQTSAVFKEKTCSEDEKDTQDEKMEKETTDKERGIRNSDHLKHINLLKDIKEKEDSASNQMEIKPNKNNLGTNNSVIIMIENDSLNETAKEHLEIRTNNISFDSSNINERKTTKELTNKFENKNERAIEIKEEIKEIEQLIKLNSVRYEIDIVKQNYKKDNLSKMLITHKEEANNKKEQTSGKKLNTDIENKEINLSYNEEETNEGYDVKSIHTENYILYDKEDVFKDNESFDQLFLDESINLKDTDVSMELVETEEQSVTHKEINAIHNITDINEIEFYRIGTNTDQSVSVSSSLKEMYISNYEDFIKKEEQEEEEGECNVSIHSQEAQLIENPNYQVLYEVPIKINHDINQIFTHSNEVPSIKKQCTIKKNVLQTNNKSSEKKKKEITSVSPINEETNIYYYKSGTIYPFKKRYSKIQHVEFQNITHINGGKILSFNITLDEDHKKKEANYFIKYVTKEHEKICADELKGNPVVCYNINSLEKEPMSIGCEQIKEHIIQPNKKNLEFHSNKYDIPNQSQSAESVCFPKVLHPKNQESRIDLGISHKELETSECKKQKYNNKYRIKEGRRRIMSENISSIKEKKQNDVYKRLNNMFEKMKNKLCCRFRKEHYIEYVKEVQMNKTQRFSYDDREALNTPRKLKYNETNYLNKHIPDIKYTTIHRSKNIEPKEISNMLCNSNRTGHTNESKRYYNNSAYVTLLTMNDNTFLSNQLKNANPSNENPQKMGLHNVPYNQNTRNHLQVTKPTNDNDCKIYSNANISHNMNPIMKNQFRTERSFTRPMKREHDIRKEKETPQWKKNQIKRNILNEINNVDIFHNNKMNHQLLKIKPEQTITQRKQRGISENILQTKSEDSKLMNCKKKEIKHMNYNIHDRKNPTMLIHTNQSETNKDTNDKTQYYYSYSALNEHFNKVYDEPYHNVYSTNQKLYENNMVDKQKHKWTPNEYFKNKNIQKENYERDFLFKKNSLVNAHPNESNKNTLFNSCCSTKVSTRNRSMGLLHSELNVKNYTIENLNNIPINQ